MSSEQGSTPEGVKAAEDFLDWLRTPEGQEHQEEVDASTRQLLATARKLRPDLLKFTAEDFNLALRASWKEQLCDKSHALLDGEDSPESRADTCYSEPPGF